MMVSIPPKYSVAQVIGYLKGKSAIHIARSVSSASQNPEPLRPPFSH